MEISPTNIRCQENIIDTGFDQKEHTRKEHKIFLDHENGRIPFYVLGWAHLWLVECMMYLWIVEVLFFFFLENIKKKKSF
jgi:hypothetical protein